ncbi:MAG TPA: NAD(P)-dependent oxidoreductase [Luteolibacter sp.]|nr:NAD(P)-dependent oxidoreductase [Luteolibacter sp.]
MSRSTTRKVAVLGLGIVGSRVHARLVAAGWDAACWNRTPKNMPGERSAPEEAVAHADVISIYLKDSPAVRGVMERVANHLRPEHVVLNHSTLDLATTTWLHELCMGRGCRFIDAPFTGSRQAAEDGKLVFYIGGDENHAAELEDYLAVSSRKRLPCGPVGSATVVKLATNLISACTVQAMAEALAIATRHGVPAEQLAGAVAENASGSPLAAMKFPAMIGGDYGTHFSLANMAKDSRYMLDLAQQAGVTVPGIDAVSQRMHELCEDGHGDLDYSVLAKPYFEEP